MSCPTCGQMFGSTPALAPGFAGLPGRWALPGRIGAPWWAGAPELAGIPAWAGAPELAGIPAWPGFAEWAGFPDTLRGALPQPWWRPTPGGGWAIQYPPGMAGIPYAWYPGYGLVQ